jgi:hypothetical protein
MPLRRSQIVFLRDGQERDLGRVAVDRVERDLVFGQFMPGPDYPLVERVFAEYVEAANDQLLSRVGELDEQIGRLGLRLSSADGGAVPAIHDVQIGEGVITFRTDARGDDALSADTSSLRGLPSVPAGSDAPAG